MCLRLAPLAALFLTLPTQGAGQVFVVAPTGPYTTIQAAVDAAGDGDIVLVESGSYSGFSIADKGVSVIANAGASVVVTSGIAISDLAVTRHVALHNLRVTVAWPTFADALQLTNNQGSIRVEECALPGSADFFSHTVGSRGAAITSSGDVAFARCDLLGGFCPVNGGSGLVLVQSNAALFDTRAVGSTGGSKSRDGTCAANAGGIGAWLVSGSQLHAWSASFIGGDGGSASTASFGFCGGCADGGWGNSGLHIETGNSAVALYSRFRGGKAGKAWGACGADGGAGAGVTGLTPTVIFGRGMRTESIQPMHEGATVSTTIHGTPGDNVWLLRGDNTAYRVRSYGVQLVDPVGPPTLLGTVGSNGTLAAVVAAGDLAPGAQGRVEFLQTLHVSGTWTLGSPMTLVTLDPTF
jgi:hypothetical protein